MMSYFTADKFVQLVKSLGNRPGNQSGIQGSLQNAPDLDDADLLILLGYDPKTGAASVCPRNWKRHGLHQIRAYGADCLSKAIQDLNELGTEPFAFAEFELQPCDLLPQNLLKSQEAASASTSAPASDNHDLGPAERWITVHPHGEEGKGVPVKIKRNHDKSWSIAGGAGGKINGLRLVHVKSPEEYKALGKERARQRREKEDQEKAKHFESVKEKHRASLRDEAEATGEKFTPEHIEKEAQKRTIDELNQTRAAQTKASADLEAQKQKAIDEHLGEIAKAQGWDTAAFTISAQSLKELQGQKESEILANNPKMRARLASENPNTVAAAREDLQKQAGQLVQKIQAKHQKLVLRRVLELGDNLSDLVASAADGISHETMGDVSIGDLVKQTLGDSGKGYVAALRSEAEARGMVLPNAKEQAEGQNRQSRLERHGFNLDSAAHSEQFMQRVQEGAAAAREEVRRAAEQLGEKGEGPLGKIQSLDTMPNVTDMKSAVETLSRFKQLKATLAATDEEKQRIEDAKSLDEIPKSAIVHATPLSNEEALQQVLDDLSQPGERKAENERQRAMGDLIDCYNAQDSVAPLVSHRLSGHNALFGNVAQIAGVRGPDPLMADIFGPEGTAHILRRALELSTQGDAAKTQGLRAGLEAHHIETQIALADSAVEHAKELMNQAENLEDFPLDSVDALMAGLDQAKQKNDLVRQAREHLGVALGRLEAGAALNYAFMGKPKDEVQIPLGALSTEDALIKAGAAGLTKADVFDPATGDLKEAGHFRIYNDGKNKFLVIHGEGLQHLAQSLQEDPAHLKRVRLAGEIKDGKHDEQNWLPKGFSPRPAIDVSGGDGVVVPRHDLQLNLDGKTSPDEIGEALKNHIAQKIEAGQDALSVTSSIRAMRQNPDIVPQKINNAYAEALKTVAPEFKRTGNAALDGEGALAHQNKIRELFNGYHADWVKQEITAGRMDSSEQSIHNQRLPLDWKTRDLVHQVALQDPRFQHAFADVGCLGRQGRAALRDYAFEHIFRDHEGKPIDPKNKENPTQALSPDERRVWEKWRDLSHGGKADPYKAIQKHLADSAESSGGGLFGDEASAEPHTFASLDLNDDAAVITAAQKHAADLGFKGEARNIDLQTRKYDIGYPELEVTDNKSEREVANAARRRIKGFLRDHAFRQMMGTPDIGMPEAKPHPVTGKIALAEPHKVFNPDLVHTGSQRWAEYVAAMGGGDKEAERRAYQTIQEKMKGDFAGRFAKGYEQLHGKQFQTAPVPLTFGDAHSLASLSRDRRKEVESMNKSERAKLHKRKGGKFDFDNTGAKQEAARNASLMGDALFSVDEGKTEKQQLDTHRLSLGGAAEAMVRGLMPNINLKKGTAAAGDIDMSSATGIKRQRAIKQIEAMGRVGLTLGVGSGKTAISLGAFSHLKSKGKVQRAIMAVPSVVQEQFGSEAARFYDLTDKKHPQWFSEAGASPETRRAAYHKNSGHDICVVTHQALRDDLAWAVAQHKFDGDEKKAEDFLANAPETERNKAMQAALDHHGWNFDMSVVDEGHNLLNRAGKENSAMANTIDAFTADKAYHVPMSADLLGKNDASESFDALRKIAPARYVNDEHPDANAAHIVSRSEFLRKYNVNTPAAHEALQRELAPYHYAESIKPDSALDPQFHSVEMTHPQKKDYNDTLAMFQRARAARKRGAVDIEAIKVLSPSSFANASAEQHEEIAAKLAGSLGILRDAALDRVVNQHPQGAKLEWLDHRLGLNQPQNEAPSGGGLFGDDEPEPTTTNTTIKRPEEHCPIIFAHNREAVSLIEKHLADKGVRTARLDGSMSGAEKEAAKVKFSPQFDKAAGRYVTDPGADVMICSDAGAVGWNGQRSRHIIHWDTPHTSMVHEQRTGRAYRVGQEHDVHCDTLMTNTPYEIARRKRLERKSALRETLTTPAELIDDSGLAWKVHQQTQAARSQLVNQSLNKMVN